MITNEMTLIQRIYGMYKIINNKEPLYFIIIENVFGNHQNEIDIIYDLKGSHYGRECTKEELKNKDTVRKDINFEHDLMRGNISFEIDVDFKEKFDTQLANDVEFFKDNNIIDQSLILGVINHDNLNTSNNTGSQSNTNKDKRSNQKSLFRHLDNIDYSESSEDDKFIAISLNKTKSLDQKYS